MVEDRQLQCVCSLLSKGADIDSQVCKWEDGGTTIVSVSILSLKLTALTFYEAAPGSRARSS